MARAPSTRSRSACRRRISRLSTGSCTRCWPSSRSTGSTISWARRGRRPCTCCASPPGCSPRCGTQARHLLRFANGLFAAMWDREHVESVQIDVPEKLGITDRSQFYDATGAVLDMLVTHLFQVAAEIAMEPPASLGALDLQAAREKVISCFRPLDPAEVVLGQFAGYRDVPGVAASSRQDTYVAAPPWIGHDRWRGG